MYLVRAKGVADMSFRGETAQEVRIRFIDAFEEVAARLARAERSLVQQLHALDQPRTLRLN